MEFITDSDDLEVGALYWLKHKRTGEVTVDKCGMNPNGWKYFDRNFWTDNENPQGFKRWWISKVEIPSEVLKKD